MTRRDLFIGGAAGATALAGGVKVAEQYGLLPPNSGGVFVPGEALTYAAQRLLASKSFAREFRPDQISANPFGTSRMPKDAEYLRMRENGFADWRLQVEGLVANPRPIGLADLRSYPASSQITQLVCEEGWSYIAEWKGAPLSHILQLVGAKPEAKFVMFLTTQKYWWGSIDMADALHPQTLIAYEMNGGAIPAQHGGPMRLRVPRQLGYKSLKFITRMVVTDSIKGFGEGKGASSVEGGYSWYAGI